MKQKEFQTWKEKSPAEIQQALGDAYAAYDALKIDIMLEKTKNVREVQGVKKTIAQLHTILKSRTAKKTI